MDDFSWRDTARAIFGQCLPCFLSSTTTSTTTSSDEEDSRRNPARIFQNEELEGLLVDPSSSSDNLSLHSDFGRNRERRKRKKKNGRKGMMRVFGIDLFGRRSTPAQEEEPGEERDEEEETSALDPQPFPSPNTTRRPQQRQPSSIPDPVILTESSILSHVNHNAEEEEERQLKKEAKLLRREMKKAAKLLLLQQQQQQQQHPEVEGYWSPQQEEFGAFQYAAPEGADEDEDEMDFGAENYARRPPPNGGSSSRGGSDTHSQTTTPISPTFYIGPNEEKRKKKKKSKSSKATHSSASTATAVDQVEQQEMIDGGEGASAKLNVEQQRRDSEVDVI